MLNHDDGHCPAGSCTVDGILPYFRKRCDNHPFCFLYAHTEEDPCPTVSKYLEIVYSCKKVGFAFPPVIDLKSLLEIK